MGIILLLVCFISVFFNLATFFGTRASNKEVLVISVLLLSAAIVLITEGLSLLHQLDFGGILISWVLISLFNLGCLYQKRFNLAMFYQSLKKSIIGALSGLQLYEKLILSATLIMLVMVFVQGIIYPPNNWDSMTYHLARIPNWISHQSVEHYATGSIRQIYQPPFAEYVIMHFNILNRADYFSASVQFLFLLFTVVAILCIVDELGLGRKYQVIAIGLTFSIPEVLLQASSTQNDIVVSFFIISACIFAFKAVKQPVFKNYFLLGLAIGIGILTKGTAYIYLAPVILVFAAAVLIRLYKTKNLRYLIYSLAVVVLIVGINSGFYARNYKLYHNILGVDKTESQMYANQKMSPLLLLSSMVKNAGLHFGIIFDRHIQPSAEKVIYKLHRWAGVDINDPAVNYLDMKFTTATPVTHEDASPNLLHFLLISISAVLLTMYIVKRKGNSIAKLLFIVTLLQMLLFCYYLKWQPWHTRLHTPLFLLFIPLVVYVSAVSNWFGNVVYATIVMALVFSYFTVLHNMTRPLGKEVLRSRYQNFFFAKPGPAYTEYSGIMKVVKDLHYKNIGLLLGGDDWEYPLFTGCYSRELNPIHINVDNATANSKVKLNEVDCIISTLVNRPYIDYKGKRFYNHSMGNKVIYLYDSSLQLSISVCNVSCKSAIKL